MKWQLRHLAEFRCSASGKCSRLSYVRMHTSIFTVMVCAVPSISSRRIVQTRRNLAEVICTGSFTRSTRLHLPRSSFSNTASDQRHTSTFVVRTYTMPAYLDFKCDGLCCAVDIKPAHRPNATKLGSGHLHAVLYTLQPVALTSIVAFEHGQRPTAHLQAQYAHLVYKAY